MERDQDHALRLNEKLGERVAKARGGRGLTQAELARRSKLSRTSMVLIEAGRQGMLLSRLYEIARQLGVEPSDLLPPLKDVFPETSKPQSPQSKLKASEEKKIETIVINKLGSKYAEPTD